MGVLNSYDSSSDEITVTWSVDDVLEMRPNLTVDQAREVLHAIKHNHDASIGINWDVVVITADNMFNGDDNKLVYEFNLGDVDDPHVYVQAHLQEWISSQGENAYDDVTYTLIPDEITMGWKVKVYDAKSED